ncbi:YciI family protein [Sphingomonas aliaeris]|uniref:YciI family protein n=1 Tax=Sphingomonas aliaeris TaxID=2759526 RepID=A0A974NVK0_9SPHN|nr:YciI family protein [Sphingomonas aliaeris]QQV77670.1 YciI family protein [Sphingomonas aliaeris]
MPYFLILAPDRPGALDLRIAHRQDHLDYWAARRDVVKVAGAMLDEDRPCGSSFLIETSDLAAAQALIAGDPFTAAGIFAGTEQIVAIRPAIGEWLPTP